MHEVWKQINQLNREQIIELLEGIGIACFDDESTQLLREALFESIESGEIPLYQLEAH